MRVVYEGGIYEIMRLGGIARYFIEVINRLDPAAVQPVVMVPDDQAFPFTHPQLTLEKVRTRPPLKLLRRFWRKAQHGVLENRTRSLGGGLTHWTYYVGLCRRTIGRGSTPNVITVYDFIHEAFPELDPDGQHRRWQRQAIEAADHICCISQTTHAELCQRYPEAASRASVTLLGNSFQAIAARSIPLPLSDRPFILFVGRRGGYKNFDAVWEAWKRARSRVKDLALVAVGPPLKARERRRLAADHDMKDFFHLGTVSDEQLKGLYQACRAFVFPSKMEGFGLPALEAMESGAPVIASSCDALREVLDSAGYYFDAGDIDTLTDLLIAAGGDCLDDRQKKIDLGHRRARQFSWDQTAHQTMQAYHGLLANLPLRRQSAA
jgi:glycosyltransferase involved in cell wall biosynthesis